MGVMCIFSTNVQSSLVTDKITAVLKLTRFNEEKGWWAPYVKILNVEDLNDYIDDYYHDGPYYFPPPFDFTKYGESFFNDNYLYFYHIVTPGMPNEFEIKSIFIKEENVQVDVIQTMEGDNGAMETWLLILEMDKTLSDKNVSVIVTKELWGDVNGDGGVDDRDLQRLLQYLTGWDVEIFPGADVNGDGVVNDHDILRLMQYLTGWYVILGPVAPAVT